MFDYQVSEYAAIGSMLIDERCIPDVREVLSSSEKSYVTTVSGVSDEKNIVKFTINFQYVDGVLLVTSYSRT